MGIGAKVRRLLTGNEQATARPAPLPIACRLHQQGHKARQGPGKGKGTIGTAAPAVRFPDSLLSATYPSAATSTPDMKSMWPTGTRTSSSRIGISSRSNPANPGLLNL